MLDRNLIIWYRESLFRPNGLARPHKGQARYPDIPMSINPSMMLCIGPLRAIWSVARSLSNGIRLWQRTDYPLLQEYQDNPQEDNRPLSRWYSAGLVLRIDWRNTSMIYDHYPDEFATKYDMTFESINSHYKLHKYWLETENVSYERHFGPFMLSLNLRYPSGYISWTRNGGRLVNVVDENRALAIHAKYGLWWLKNFYKIFLRFLEKGDPNVKLYHCIVGIVYCI